MVIENTHNRFLRKDGIVYTCWDIYPTRTMAEAQVGYFKRQGLKAFQEKHELGNNVYVEARKGKEIGLF